MKKTLLLVFIHGFKGDDKTFSAFPRHLSALLTVSLPHLTITPLIYPAFETRGDLADTVKRFTQWLTAAVVDLEVGAQQGTGRMGVEGEEGVRVVIVGHSMGGLVGAECVLGLVGEGSGVGGAGGEGGEGADPVKAGTEEEERRRNRSGMDMGGGRDVHMFPHVQGLLAFDTPYLGISPGVVAHGAEGHWNAGKAWYDGAAALFGTASGAAAKAEQEGKGVKPAGDRTDTKSLPSTSPSSPIPPSTDSNPVSPWSKWSKYALYTAAASTLAAAAGTSAYLARNTLTTTLTTTTTWLTSHLEFIGCLARPEELRLRLLKITQLRETHGLGFGNVYTLLGKGAEEKLRRDVGGEGRNEWSEGVLGRERTFCNVPRREKGGKGKEKEGSREGRVERGWWVALNEVAEDEVAAHCDMFIPEKNPGYFKMGEEARDVVVGWVDQDWYQSSQGDQEEMDMMGDS